MATNISCKNFENHMRLLSLPVCEQVHFFLKGIATGGNHLSIFDYRFEKGEFVAIMEYLGNNKFARGKIHRVTIDNCTNLFTKYDEHSSIEEQFAQREDFVKQCQVVLFSILKLEKLASLSLRACGLDDYTIVSLMSAVKDVYVQQQHSVYRHFYQCYLQEQLVESNNDDTLNVLSSSYYYHPDAFRSESIKFPPLQALFLDDNEITHVGCKSIAEVLFRGIVFHSEQFVMANGISFGGASAEFGTVYRPVPFPLLTSFSISGNPIGNRGVFYLFTSLLNQKRKMYGRCMKCLVSGYYADKKSLKNIELDGMYSETENSISEESAHDQQASNNVIQVADADEELDDDEELHNNFLRQNIYDNIDKRASYSLLSMGVTEFEIEASSFGKQPIANKRSSTQDIVLDSRRESGSSFVSVKGNLFLAALRRIRAKLKAVCLFISYRYRGYNLAYINVANCQLTPISLALISDVCVDNDSILHLNISGNNICCDEEIPVELCKIQEIPPVSHTCDYVARIIRHSHVNSLDLSRTGISDIGIKVVSSGLRKLHSDSERSGMYVSFLQRIDLSNNPISHAGANWICSCLQGFYLDKFSVSLSLADSIANAEQHRVKVEIDEPEPDSDDDTDETDETGTVVSANSLRGRNITPVTKVRV